MCVCVCVCVCVSCADTCNSAHAVRDTQEDKDISFEKGCETKKKKFAKEEEEGEILTWKMD